MEIGVFVDTLKKFDLVLGDAPMLSRLFSKENLYALIFCLMLIALVVFTADIAPVWIYQGF